ncbi:MAG: hypothetical protein EU539_09220 [Promethearchaeota archaeon]|nr:MAG: hypothetical protein EU539_09220 [Candidatus Lokiarchaeota archaeon]
MLDILLVQQDKSGLNLLEYRQENTILKVEHSDIFSGFLKAIQNISKELDIGFPVLISTEGVKGHNCIIVHNPPINIILLVDHDDPIDLWREQGKEIAKKFLEQFGNLINAYDVSKFKEFIPVVKKMCQFHGYCE